MWNYLTEECRDSCGNRSPSMMWRLLLSGAGVAVLAASCWLANH